MEEQWRKLTLDPYFNDLYEVSNMGRVRSLGRTIVDKNGNERFCKGRIIKQWVGERYSSIRLTNNKQQRTFATHIAVLEAFVPRPLGANLVVHHIDNDGNNNKISNLQWATHSANIKDAYKGEAGDKIKERNNKLSKEKATMIRDLYSTGGYSYAKLAPVFGVSRNQIAQIVRGQVWQ